MNEIMDVGIALLAGLLAGKLMNRVKVPLVAGYILAGLVLGQSLLGLINGRFLNETSFIGDLALGFIAFSIGEELKIKSIAKMGKSILAIAFLEAFGAFVLVTGGLLLLRQPLPNALLLGAVSSATAPAATVMVINEFRAKGVLTNTLLAVVAIDDAICLIIFGIAASIAKTFLYSNGAFCLADSVGRPLVEIGSALLLGVVLGLLLSLAMNRVKQSSELLVLEVGFIALSIGISLLAHLSALLANMALGAVVANFSAKRRQAFETIGTFVPPIYTIFFVLAGARLDMKLLTQIGWIGLAYTILRIIGKVGGASLGAVWADAEANVKKYIGFGLLSQIGVAVGLAMVVSREFSGTNLGNIVITILLATTIITEIIGPLCTKYALTQSGEAGRLKLS